MTDFRTRSGLVVAAGFALSAAPAVGANSSAVSAGTSSHQTAVFAGGCFWGIDAVFKHVKGVTKVRSGYTGGDADTAEYETVSTGTTGHAESVEVTFDPGKVSYNQLLKVFFLVAHDPTELDRQGPDSGTQYRSAIFFTDPAQKKAALDHIAKLTREKKFDAPIVTQVVALKQFYSTEAYHQNYYERNPNNPYIEFVDQPKVERLRQELPSLYRAQRVSTAPSRGKS